MSNKNFWAISDGSELSNMERFAIEMNSEPIPAKTQVLAFASEAKWDSYGNDEYISITWEIVKPEEYARRKIFQKIRVNEEDAKKRDRAIRMLAAIDTNAKAGLMGKGQQPTDADLQKLTNRMMVLMLQVWAIEDQQTGETKKGNWVSAISPKDAGVPDKVVRVEYENMGGAANEDDMPF